MASTESNSVLVDAAAQVLARSWKSADGRAPTDAFRLEFKDQRERVAHVSLGTALGTAARKRLSFGLRAKWSSQTDLLLAQGVLRGLGRDTIGA